MKKTFTFLILVTTFTIFASNAKCIVSKENFMFEKCNVQSFRMNNVRDFGAIGNGKTKDTAAFYMTNMEKIYFQDVKINWDTNSPNRKYGIMAENSEIAEINSSCNFRKPMKLSSKENNL